MAIGCYRYFLLGTTAPWFTCLIIIAVVDAAIRWQFLWPDPWPEFQLMKSGRWKFTSHPPVTHQSPTSHPPVLLPWISRVAKWDPADSPRSISAPFRAQRWSAREGPLPSPYVSTAPGEIHHARHPWNRSGRPPSPGCCSKTPRNRRQRPDRPPWSSHWRRNGEPGAFLELPWKKKHGERLDARSWQICWRGQMWRIDLSLDSSWTQRIHIYKLIHAVNNWILKWPRKKL